MKQQVPFILSLINCYHNQMFQNRTFKTTSKPIYLHKVLLKTRPLRAQNYRMIFCWPNKKRPQMYLYFKKSNYWINTLCMNLNTNILQFKASHLLLTNSCLTLSVRMKSSRENFYLNSLETSASLLSFSLEDPYMGGLPKTSTLDATKKVLR